MLRVGAEMKLSKKAEHDKKASIECRYRRFMKRAKQEYIDDESSFWINYEQYLHYKEGSKGTHFFVLSDEDPANDQFLFQIQNEECITVKLLFSLYGEYGMIYFGERECFIPWYAIPMVKNHLPQNAMEQAKEYVNQLANEKELAELPKKEQKRSVPVKQGKSCLYCGAYIRYGTACERCLNLYRKKRRSVW